MYHFDIEKFWRKLKELKLGSGTLAERAGVLPDDVQRLIFRGYADDEIGEKIVDILGEDVLEDSLQNEDNEEEEGRVDLDEEIDSIAEDFAIADYTINQIKEKIENRELGLGKALRLERAQDDPRVTLLDWLKEQMEEK